MPNFSSKNEGTWVFFDSNNESLGGVCIKLLSPVEEEQIQKLTTTKKMNIIRGQQNEVVETNEKLRNELLYDLWITDWKNVELDGKPMKCTKLTKLQMMKSTDFARFVLDGLVLLSNTNKAIEEARVKNLSDTSSGNTADSAAKDV